MSTTQPVSPAKKKTQYILERERLIDFQVVKSDLENFTCRCNPHCLSMHDATLVGEVRNTILSLGSRSQVSPIELFSN